MRHIWRNYYWTEKIRRQYEIFESINNERTKFANDKKKRVSTRWKKSTEFFNPFETCADLVIHKIWNAARIMVEASDLLPKPNVIHTPSGKHKTFFFPLYFLGVTKIFILWPKCKHEHEFEFRGITRNRQTGVRIAVEEN